MDQVDDEAVPDGFEVISKIRCPSSGRTIYSSLVTIDDKTPSWYLSNYNEIQLIGHGTFGNVFSCRNKLDGKRCAIKKVRLGATHDDSFAAAINEASIWSMLDHPNIVKYYGCWVEKRLWGEEEDHVLACQKQNPCLYLNLEECERTLASEIQSGLERRETFDILKGIVKGLRYIHSQGFIHGDISAANILLSNGIPKICDFGKARKGHRNGKKDDICMLGLLISEMVDPSSVYLARQGKFPKSFKSLADHHRRMTSDDSKERPSSSELWKSMDSLKKGIMEAE